MKTKKLTKSVKSFFGRYPSQNCCGVLNLMATMAGQMNTAPEECGFIFVFGRT